MAGFVAYLTLLGLIAVAVAVVGAIALSRIAPRGRAGRVIASGLLFVAGTVPPSVLGVLWYARAADYRWAIGGPGVFAHLGGGPTMLGVFVLTAIWTAGCWGAAVWIAAREPGRGERG